MKRFLAVVVLGVARTVGACGGGDDKQAAKDGGTTSSGGGGGAEAPASIKLWVGFSERELGVIKGVVAEFEKSHPNIKVTTVGGIDDDKIIAAIRGGNSPDVAQSFTADNTGLFRSSGGWIDLKPYMQKDKIDESIFPQVVRDYTQYKGTRCSLPMLADT